MPTERGEDFVSGNRIQFGDLARSILSSAILAWTSVAVIIGGGVITFWERLISTWGLVVGEIIAAPWEAGTTMLNMAWTEATMQVGIDGPFDFFIATIVVALTFYIVIVTFRAIARRL